MVHGVSTHSEKTAANGASAKEAPRHLADRTALGWAAGAGILALKAERAVESKDPGPRAPGGMDR